MSVNKPDLSTVYLILDGNNILTKQDFLREIGALLKFPDYYGNNWDALEECLGDIVSIWQQENPTFLEPFIGSLDAVDKGLKVNVIWLYPENMFNNNPDDFGTAIDILRSANSNKTIPLNFYSSSYMGES